MSLFHVTAAAFGARSIIFYLRSTVAQKAAGSFTVFRLLRRSPGTRLFHRGHILTQIPKMTLLCWGAVNVSCYAATCQEAVIHRAAPTTERKPVAKVQVHKLVFVLRLSLRALVLLLKFVPLLLLSPLTWVSPGFASRWLGVLLWVTETSGPTFIKLGQWASTRRDIFSQEFCDRFSRLHVKVRPHSWAHTKQCLRRAFGDGWRRLFVFEDEEPVGSGCVAQVYRGWARVDGVQDPGFQTLVEDMERGEHLLEAWEIPGLWGMVSSLWGLWRRKKGEEWADAPGSRHGGSHPDVEHLIPVAIKVLHPGIKSQVEIDLLLMRAASWLLHRLPGLKWLSLPEIVEEFEMLMTKQIDLRFEARNIERFKENFRDVDYVRFPTPLRPFVTRTILVETFEESEPISKYLGSDVPQEVKQRIARMGVQTMLKMVFVDNFVHGDLHPGNILVQRRGAGDQGGDSAAAGSGGGGEARQDKATLTDLWDTVMVSMRPASEPLQLVLLDAGIVAQLEPRDRDNFRAVFTAVVLRQGERVAELILHHARANECEDVPGFKREMAALVDEALSTTLSLGKVQVADLLSRVFGLLITHKVKLESNFASMVIAIMVLEGLGRSLDPNLDILEMAKPLLLKNCASLL